MTRETRRSDATANRDRILAVARDALSDSNGATEDLKLHLVAKAAGVGQGTLYRHFPTREHLVAEVYREEIAELVDSVPSLLAEHEPIDALSRWMDRLVHYARVKRGVMAAIEASTWQDLLSGHHESLDQALGRLIEESRAAGDVRAGVDATDVILLLGALSRIPASEWNERAPTVVAMILGGLRPG